MKKTPCAVLSLLKGISDERIEYVKGGGSPTVGVTMAGWEGMGKTVERETIDPW
jgi:hypothetical protein